MRVFLTNLLSNDRKPVDINKLTIPNFSDRQRWDDMFGWSTSDFKEEVSWAARFDIQNALARLNGADRMFKTHDAFRDPASREPLFSATATLGAICIIRHPLDVVLSFANHMNRPVDVAIEKMNNRAARMADNSTTSRPQLTQILGDWSWHVSSWADATEIRTSIIRYEDMTSSPQATFAGACSFLGLTNSATEIASAIERSRFETLKEQEGVRGFREKPRRCPRFFNEGRVGRWRDVLTSSQVKKITSMHGDMMKRFGYVDA